MLFIQCSMQRFLNADTRLPIGFNVGHIYLCKLSCLHGIYVQPTHMQCTLLGIGVAVWIADI
jgi:hypothetical protein